MAILLLREYGVGGWASTQMKMFAWTPAKVCCRESRQDSRAGDWDVRTAALRLLPSDVTVNSYLPCKSHRVWGRAEGKRGNTAAVGSWESVSG